MGFEPRWKYRWNLAQETLAVKVLRITEGPDTAFLSLEQPAETMRDAGLEVTTNDRSRRTGYVRLTTSPASAAH